METVVWMWPEGKNWMQNLPLARGSARTPNSSLGSLQKLRDLQHELQSLKESWGSQQEL